MSKEKKEYNLNKKILIWIIGIVILFSVIIVITSKIKQKVKFDKNSSIIVDQMEKLKGKSLQLEYTNGERKYVNNFDISKDTLPFKNFSTSKSTEGNCEGFSAFELLVFEGKLDKRINLNRNLSEYHIKSDDIQIVYGKDAKYEYEEGINEDNMKKNNNESINNDEEIFRDLIEQATGKKDVEKSLKRKQYFDETKLENSEVEKILKYISEIHENKDRCALETIPYYSDEIGSIDDIQKSKKYKTLDPYVITEKIDNNKLVEVGITSKIGGHAVLIYGYEIVDKSNIKFYVCDSNLPINEKQSINKNNEIKKEAYILFTKDILNNDWSFIYGPHINGENVYMKYNSFLPSARFIIYDL